MWLICQFVTQLQTFYFQVENFNYVYKFTHLNKINKKRTAFDYLGWAAQYCPFTGAIPLLHGAGAFACCVSALGRFAPPQTTWWFRAPPIPPYRHRAQCGRLINMGEQRTELPTSRRPSAQASRQLDYRNAPPFPAIISVS